jgi:hypothetical protein
MYAHTKLIDLLSRDTGPTGVYRDYLVLAEIVRQRFPADSPFAKALNSLGERIEAMTTTDGSSVDTDSTPHIDEAQHQVLRKALNEIGEAAKQLIITESAPGSEPLRESERQRIVRMVNDAFYTSNLFTAAKWILAVSLALLGLGSLGYAGFNIYASEKVQAAQQTLSETTNRVNGAITEIDRYQNQLSQRKTN